MSAVVEIVEDVVNTAVDVVEDVVGGVVDVVESVVGVVEDVVNWAVDDIVQPVLNGVGDVIQAALDDPITTIAKIGAVATGNAWALPLIDGAAVAANGGDLGDVVKAAAISYATGKVGEFSSTYVNPKIASAGLNSTVEAAVQAGIKGGTQSATTAIIYGQDPLQAFATGGLNAAVGASLGKIADNIDERFENFTGEFDAENKPIIGGWEKLQDGVKESITASLTAEITGGDVSASQFTSIISKYTGVSETMNKFLQENAGFDKGQAIVMTNALTNAATVALEGNPELSSDAFFAQWDKYGMKALKDIVDRPVDAAIDKITGASSATQDAANALNEASANAVAAADGFKATQVAIQKKVIEQERLEGIYNAALRAYNQNPTQATVDALNAAAGAYQTFADQFKVDYDSTLKPALDKYEADYNTYTAQIPELDAAYTAKTKAMMSDIDDLNASMKPVYDKATLAAALSLRPNFDAEAYKEFLGQDVDNVAEHFLLNGQQGPANKSEADATLDAIRLSTVENALAAKGLTLASLEPGQLAKYLAYADKEIKNAASITGLDLDKFANIMIADAALTPELTTALKDAGFIPQSTDDYNSFLSGEYIKLDAKNSDGSNVFLDTTGMTGDEVKDLLASKGYSTNNIVNVGSLFANAMEGGADDPAFDKPSLSAVDAAATDFKNNPPEPTLDTVTFGAGVDVNTLTSGGAVLVNTDGKLSWELPSTKQEKLGETNISSVTNAINPNIDASDVEFNAIYGPLAFKEVPYGFSYLSDDKLTAFTEDGKIESKILPPASGVVVATIAGLDDDQGKQFDEDTGGTLWSVYNKLKQVYLDETPDDQQEAFGNAASVVTGATSEMLQAISGLATLVGANPNNTVGQTAKNLLALSGDLRSDAWVAGAEAMQKQSQDYDKEWRQDNPGKEPSTVQKGWLKAQSIWGNLSEHPVQFLAENVASEILQEIPIFLVSGGVGNVAKAALLQGGEAYAKKFATKAAVGSAVALDAVEAFGGTAAAAFDETYANAIAQGMSEQEATDLAMDTAQKAGTIALFTAAASAGIGGAALAKNLLGDNASEFAADAFQKLGKKIKDGGTVAIKEGTTEFIEEALPQLFTATVNSQIDPNYDVAGSVFENGFMGAVSGYGVGATLYTGNAVADALMSLNPTVINTVKNAGSAEAATAALNNLGITDTTILNNVLNSTYDTMYVSTNEAAKIFKDANPGFEPTDAEIESFVSNRPESDVAAAVASYIDPKFLDADEVKAAAAAEGITLTDEQAEAYVGQKDEAAAIAEISTEYDPLATTAAEAKQFFEDKGFTPTNQQVANFVAAKTEEEQKAAIAEFIDPRQVTTDEAKALFDALGYEATNEEVADFVGQGGADFAATTETGVGAYVDPRQVTAEEAREFFTNLGYEPTDEQVEQFVAQVKETTQSGLIASYVDPRQVTREEVQAIADEEGLTLTDALAATYVGQGVAANYQTEKLSEARAEYDPLATTLEEATQFFADTGYTATPEEIAQFVASKTEETQTSAIGGYVDPRQVTTAEAEEFLSAIGYQPSQEDIAAFTGQVNDENYQATQKAAIDEFVDPRFFDAGEVRAAYEELGLVDVTQEDVDRFVGQFDPESEDYDAAGFEAFQRKRLESYLPTATYNLISKTIGSPAVEDDPNTPEDESKEATGIYKAIEDGTSKDDALEAAIAKLTEDLGLSEDAMLKQLGLTKEELSDEIDTVAEEVAGVKEDVAGVAEDVADVAEDVEGLTTEIGDVETSLTKLIEDNAGDVDAALETLADDLDTTEEALLAELDTTKEELETSFTEGLEGVTSDIEGVSEDVSGLTDILGTAGVEDDPNTEIDESQDPTGLFATIKAYEDAGLDRDEALQKAIDDVASALGTTKTDLLTAIGETETSLSGKIDAATEALTETIGGVETSLGANIDAVAALIGKPARKVTQADIDFVIDLIAQENVSQELITQYDVTGDGIIDINDQTLLETALQGDQDVTLADTSMFTPATGIYGEIDANTDAITDTIANLNTEIDTKINTQTQQQNVNDLVDMLMQAEDVGGQRVDVKTPDTLADITPYNFESIFRDQGQAQKFVSPYGTTRVPTTQPANNPAGPLAFASGFAKGGQVEDENDMLLRILGEM